MSNAKDPAFIDLRLWDQDAIVLFDWLMSVDLDAIPVTHRAQKQALMDLLNQIEQALPPGATDEEIADANGRLAWTRGRPLMAAS